MITLRPIILAMTHSLEELKSGELVGTKRLKLACGLTEFPEEILQLAPTLEILDLSDNQLSKVPDSIGQLKKLKIVFFARNNFTEFPQALAKCPALSMVGFKSNQIETIPENAFPPLLQWLILTDNKIETLPKSIGQCIKLQKCGLAGNQIVELPIEMANCQHLELLRISANKLKSIPNWLFELPKLSWVAFSGNPCSYQMESSVDIESYHWTDFTVSELLGEGASGLISKAQRNIDGKDVALKVFKGDVTTDGLPEDEMKVSIATGTHDSLIPVLGKIEGHPEGKSGLIMELISLTYRNLGNPPSFDTCTRDVFDEQTFFDSQEVLNIASGIASVSVQLHSKGINHGDLYAHNILVNKSAECLLGDFGAASFYDVNSTLAPSIERIEVRAFACLLEDLIGLVPTPNIDSVLHTKLQNIIDRCMSIDVKSRPSFEEVLAELNSL